MTARSATARVRRLVARTLRRAHLLRPALCVLVVGGDAAALDATLHAVRAIPRADLAVLVATGAGDARVATAHAAADWRVRAVRAESWPDAAGLAARVRARTVVAMSAGDLPDPRGLEAALDALGRDRGIVVGAGLHLADPAAALFSADTWRRVQGSPGPLVALALGLTTAPTVVRGPVMPTRYDGGVRGMDDTTADLDAWLHGAEEAAGLVGGDGPMPAQWAASVLARAAQRFLLDAERFTDAAWQRLQRRVAALARTAGPGEVATIPVEARVRVALAEADRRADLVRFVVARRFAAGEFATRAADGSAYAVLPVPDDLPDDLVLLTPAETALRLSLRRLRWIDDSLELEVFAVLANVDLRDHEPQVSATLVGPRGRVALAVELGTDREVTRWTGSHHVNSDRGVVRARVPLADLATPGLWSCEVTVTAAGITRTGRVEHHDSGGSVALLGPRAAAGCTISVEVAPQLGIRVLPEAGEVALPQPVMVDDVVVTVEGLEVRGRGIDRLELHGPAGRLERLHGAATEATWSLRHDPWGFGPRPVPPGRYVLRAAGMGIGIGTTLGDRLPEVVRTTEHRVVVRREPAAGGHALAFSLGPPLADDEVGAYCQHRLQEWYAAAEHELDPTAVYFQAYTGQNATDSPLAIAEEMARTRPDLVATWAVADHSAIVPAGSATVLWRSRAWYAALARSGHVVTNIELESWFRRRPGQQVLQTFHGYPSKAMGIGLWRSKRFTESRIEQQLDRTSRNWSLLLTPTPEMDVHYRENYRYDGPILAAGYPRDDVLVAPGTEDRRTAARARLGIGPTTTAVLYAPTWRDDQAVDFRAARMVDHLDVAATAEALGPDHVLLLRGHRFMASAASARASRVLDVTTYPEVNDLILAADVAVLDYTSMRFDFALTGRPMVFLVPDLEDYATTKRGFLYDFRPTAPGPLLSTSAEVIDALRDLEGVRARHREEYEQFNATYNRCQDGAAAERTVERFFRPSTHAE